MRAVGDPMAHDVVRAVEPWDAYRAALGYGAFLDDPDLPHGGGLYVAWAELTDLFETGKTDDATAHALLRAAVLDWLRRPNLPDSGWVEGWIDKVRGAVSNQFRADGDFWGS